MAKFLTDPVKASNFERIFTIYIKIIVFIAYRMYVPIKRRVYF